MESTPQPHNPKPTNQYLIPGAIIVAGIFIAGSLFAAQMINGNKNPATATANGPTNPHEEVNMKEVTAADHIRGSIDAPIKLVEFSDTDCPFCQRFHPTAKAMVDANPGKVAWVYRHFNTQIQGHIHTQSEAEASECVAKIGGNDKFWSFLDMLYSKKDFSVQPAKLIATSSLPLFAASIGVNKAQFNDCFNKRTFKADVEADTADAQASGASGTPFSIVTSKAEVSKELISLLEATNAQFGNPQNPFVIYVSEDKHKIVLSGAMPKELMDEIFRLLVAVN